MLTENTINHYLRYNFSYKSHYGKYIQAYRPKKEKDLEDYLINLIRPQAHDTILDCGCGFGSVSELLSHKCKRVTALNICKNQLPKFSDKVIYKHGDFDRMHESFGNTLFDKIIFIETMGYTNNLSKLILQCKKLLNKNGKLIIKEFFVKENSNFKEQQLISSDLTKKLYNYSILNQSSFKKEIFKNNLKIKSCKNPDFTCDWSRAYNFQNSILKDFDYEIIKKHQQSDNLFECLEIISENT